jgi:transposase
VETIVHIGLDTSKSVFQLHGVDGTEQPVLRRKLGRGQVLAFFGRLPPALVALEACGASRELRMLGHEVAMILPQYVKPMCSAGNPTLRTSKRFARRQVG